MNSLLTMGKNAKSAARILASASSVAKDTALKAVANALKNGTEEILAANKTDLQNGKAAGLTDALLDRLSLSAARVADMANGFLELAAEKDPIGATLNGIKRPNGLTITTVRVPLGVIGIIYEARPNVTADAAAICLKSGNAVILRGGKEAIHSNIAIANIMRKAINQAGLPTDSIQLITDTSRNSATELMQLIGYVDVLIPRGGASLIKATVENAKVPVIETGTGNCHAFVDQSADLTMAANIVFNAKCSRPSVCNALETLLVHEAVAEKALPLIKAKLDTSSCELRGCERTVAILGDAIKPAIESDYETEFLDYILAVKVVKDIDEAVAHIAKYSSGHSECIITDSYQNAERFCNEVDAAAVYVNASTRFTDGGQFGFGAEIGISTQKLHTRGPMGAEHLTTIKYVVRGDGQVR